MSNFVATATKTPKPIHIPLFNLSYKVKVEAISLHTMKSCGEVEMLFSLFLILVLVVDEWSDLRHGLFRTEERNSGIH
jgi:hypothetical protein